METDELKAVTDAEGVTCKGDAWMSELRVVRGQVERSVVALRIVLERLERDAEDGDLFHAAEQVVDDLMEGILETVEPSSFIRRAARLEKEISEAELEDDDEWYPPKEVQQRMRVLADGLRAHAELLKRLGELEKRLKAWVSPTR